MRGTVEPVAAEEADAYFACEEAVAAVLAEAEAEPSPERVGLFVKAGKTELLDEIASYNRVDCHSTLLCRDWLLSLRPEAADWFAPEPAASEASESRSEAEERIASMVARLLEHSTDDDRPWRVLVGHLLDFHRREAKPTWWAMFSRQHMAEEDLIDDAECIGALRRTKGVPPRPDKRSTIYTFDFPAQDFKIRAGDEPLRTESLEPAGTIVELDEAAGRISLKLGPSRTPLPNSLSLIPQGPLNDKPLREAIFRYAEVVAGDGLEHYQAITDILARRLPNVARHSAGKPLVKPEEDATTATTSVVKKLQKSYLVVQGPPGAGKTYTSSRAIVSLLAAGKRVGISSLSHKAINNLLTAVEECAAEQGVEFNGVKKSSSEDQYLEGARQIANTTNNKVACQPQFNLVAGTAWLFARPDLDQALDYLFIDEAGQVSLANVIAMGVSAKNIVLVGDQMQLSQPIQGTHPGGSGVSALDHLLDGAATVPVDQGIFLPITRRMHPTLCRFISDAVYDGRLTSHSSTEQQRLLVDVKRDAEALASVGLKFVPVRHTGCSQRCPEEAERLSVAYKALLGSYWIDQTGARRRVGTDDILVVSPYNMQVDLLRTTLPDGARVGTVDKFQGQQAAAVLISMATSSGDDVPRNIEFLFSRNRLNVAISRARCLSVIFASPRLLEVSCSTVEQMQLVNSLCWTAGFKSECRNYSQFLGGDKCSIHP